MPASALIRRLVLLAFITISTLLNTSSRVAAPYNNDGTSKRTTSQTAALVHDPVGGQLTPPTHNLRRPAQKKSQYQFGLAAAHCKEDYMSWIEGIDDVTLTGNDGEPYKTTWDASVYERCEQKVSEKYSKWQRNLGSEECTAYLQYIVDRYYELPEIVYFLQPDSLAYNDKKQHKHTQFDSLQDLVAASAPVMMKNNSRIGYMNLGNEPKDATRLVQSEGPNSNPVEIINMMNERAPPYEEDSMIHMVTGACFAVKRERILANPIEFYKDLILTIMGQEDERWTCWGLEATWHVIFGEPLQLPDESIVMSHV